MRATFSWLSILILCVALAPQVHAQPKKKPANATKADVERLETRIEEQQRQIDKLVKAQQQYLTALAASLDAPAATTTDAPKADDAKPAAAAPTNVKTDAKPSEPVKAADKATVGFTDSKPRMRVEAKPKKPGNGTVVGKVAGASDAVVYIDGIVETTRGTATMKQEGKQFIPRVLVVQKGTTVAFPNLDAIFHNVFSVTPDHSFDLGSYQQGESKSVTMAKAGVISVYCNMHPQMVGNILVVPNSHYVRAGKDGFFRLTNVPAGKHRVVAWAPNSKPVIAEAEVTEAGVVTLELELKKGRASPHTKKDGLPYGSYGE
jgi:plastocyanin